MGAPLQLGQGPQPLLPQPTLPAPAGGSGLPRSGCLSRAGKQQGARPPGTMGILASWDHHGVTSTLSPPWESLNCLLSALITISRFLLRLF